MENRLIWDYLEADAAERKSKFRAFIAALKAADKEDAARFARLAITPTLDYTSLFSLAKFTDSQPPADALRVAILGGPTTHQLVKLIELFVAAENLPAVLYECDYGLFRHEILAPDSGLAEFKPNIIFIACDSRDVSRLPAPADDTETVARLLNEETTDWTRLWNAARDKWNASVIQNTFPAADYPVLGHLSARVPASPEAFTAALNNRLAETAPGHVIFHDIRLLINEKGTGQWFDPRFYLEAKMPCAPECLVPYAHSVVTLIRALRGKSRKVLVLDLDNTMWGGVVGDVGVEGIEVGQGDGQGEAFLAFQRYVKALNDRGILLAVCSKNDDAKAREPFEKRADMAVRLENIACFRANWEDKPSNLRVIANTLALGLDSFVFVDDNPFERAIVRRVLPEVAVPDMPEDPAGYVRALTLHRYFETVSFTAEDSLRARYYRENSEREALVASTGDDLGAFLQSLGMVARVEPVNPVNISRVTQLLNKSNQFNLTTHRYTQAEIEAIAASPDWSTVTISLRDRCGDNGLISILFVKHTEPTLVVDTWLMSCRVLKRGVEEFALSTLVDIARKRGHKTIEGRYIPTAKNEMVRDHYPKMGFTASEVENTWHLPVEGWEAALSFIMMEQL